MASDKPKVRAAFWLAKQLRSRNGEPKVVQRDRKILDVHFNPATLQYSIANDSNAGRGKRTKQHIRHSSAKLSMELVFDTTLTGEDVRQLTLKLAALVEAKPRTNELPTVVFDWGLYSFAGIMKTYQETVDFFSSDGVPLRAMVSLTIDQADVVLSPSATNPGGKPPGSPMMELPTSPSESTTGLAGRAGDPSQGRNIALMNNLESMRLPQRNSLILGGDNQPSLPAAFADGGAATDSGGALGAAPGGGGLSAAGVPATAGAFSGLRAAAGSRALSPLDPSALLPPSDSAALFAGADASFAVGGQARMTGSASVRSDVGADATLSDRIFFDEVQ